MKKIIKQAVSIITISSLLLLCGCGSSGDKKIRSVGDVKDKTVGVIAGSDAEECVAQSGVAGDVKTYYGTGNIADAIASGEIDCAVLSQENAEKITDKNRKLKILKEPFADLGYRIAVAKGNAQMLERLEEALAALEESGKLNEMTESWLSKGSYDSGASGAEAAEAVLVAVAPGVAPYEYYDESGNIVGLEIDILRAVCYQLGIGAELYETDTDKMIYMVESGKVSFAIGRLSEYDSDAVDYTETYLTLEQYVVVEK